MSDPTSSRPSEGPLRIESLRVKSTAVRGFSLLLLAAVAALAAPGAASAARVLAIEFDNDVNPVTRDFVKEQLKRAREENYDTFVILLDTPGGLVSSMEDIVKAELASRVPVIVYVSPEGASASAAFRPCSRASSAI